LKSVKPTIATPADKSSLTKEMEKTLLLLFCPKEYTDFMGVATTRVITFLGFSLDCSLHFNKNMHYK